MTEQNPSTANPARLSENAAGGLAYIFLVPAIIFLLAEPYNRNSYIRFHSWQCIFLAATWVVADVVILVLGWWLPFLFVFSYGLESMLTLLALVLWIMLLIKAFNGERFKLPLIGDLAEKQANG